VILILFTFILFCDDPRVILGYLLTVSSPEVWTISQHDYVYHCSTMRCVIRDNWTNRYFSEI